MAQEVEKVFPQLVKETDKGMKAVSYTHMVPILLQAINEQQLQIKLLEEKIERLFGIVEKSTPAKK